MLGFYRHGGEWHRGRHEPVVERAAWDAAQLAGEQRRKFAPSGRAGRLPKAHLCVRGFGQCGLCMQALLPRTDGGRETYVCRGRKTWGSCDLPVLDRAEVDGPLLGMFEDRALDYERTRDELAARLTERSGEALAQAARARREAAELAAQADRCQRDYRRSALTAEAFTRMSADIAGELAAAEAEAARLAAHADELAAGASGLDAESETLRRLAEVRAAVAGRVNGARDVPPCAPRWRPCSSS